jgi:hypothetical protein
MVAGRDLSTTRSLGNSQIATKLSSDLMAQGVIGGVKRGIGF